MDGYRIIEKKKREKKLLKKTEISICENHVIDESNINESRLKQEYH